jgi:hypothetical protein
MSTIYAIDPGTTHSALVRVQDDGLTVGGMWTNDMLCINLHEGVFPQGVLVIEQIEAMGMAVGKETFETVFWSGRFAQAWEQRLRPWSRVTRRQVKLHLCGSMKAKDANIRQALNRPLRRDRLHEEGRRVARHQEPSLGGTCRCCDLPRSVGVSPRSRGLNR